MANALGWGSGLVMVGSVSNTATGCGCKNIVVGDIFNIPHASVLGLDKIRIGVTGW